MRLLEFKTPTLLFKDALGALQSRFGLQRVGGAQRVYIVGGELGVVYLVHNGPKAIGLTWVKGSKALSSVYLWNEFDAAKSPDMVVDIPEGATPENTLEELAKFIQSPAMGLVENLVEDAEIENTPMSVFRHMARQFYRDITHLSKAQIEALSVDNEVPLPADIETYRDGQFYDLDPQPGQTKLYIVAKDTAGVFFEVPGMTGISAKLTQRYNSQKGTDGMTMEQQYEELRTKVELVASGRGAFQRALLVTGAPSAGKTFTVMETIKSLGLQEAKDYVIKKGSTTDVAVYRTFIEQIDGLIIFDDCDSVFATKDGRNMLKNALDTYAVREITRDNANSTNTEAMPAAERRIFVDALSRVFRGTASEDDLLIFKRYAVDPKKKVAKSSKVFGDENGFTDIEDNDTDLQDRMFELQQYFARHMPNKIDFRGRVIFISNMQNEDWTMNKDLNAILTRSFSQQMSFSDDEMLDFIDRIKDSIPAPSLTTEQKDEVLAELRDLHNHGLLKQAINFRLVQQCFDLRLTVSWKAMIAKL